jgi:bacterioferritin-associated ferredoxin
VYVCSCFGITEEQVREHAAAGACTPRQIASQSRAGTDCGSCVRRIQGLLGRVEAAPCARAAAPALAGALPRPADRRAPDGPPPSLTPGWGAGTGTLPQALAAWEVPPPRPPRALGRAATLAAAPTEGYATAAAQGGPGSGARGRSPRP